MTKVMQLGLYTTKENKLEEFADRVSEFNKKKNEVVVEMEGVDSKADQLCPTNHFKINLTFKSRETANEFWTDPKYQTNIIQ